MPDQATQWRIGYFNDVKMPLLTTQLLYNKEMNLLENMENFEKLIKIQGLTAEEIFVKNAMKRQDLHERAVQLIS